MPVAFGRHLRNVCFAKLATHTLLVSSLFASSAYAATLEVPPIYGPPYSFPVRYGGDVVADSSTVSGAVQRVI